MMPGILEPVGEEVRFARCSRKAGLRSESARLEVTQRVLQQRDALSEPPREARRRSPVPRVLRPG